MISVPLKKDLRAIRSPTLSEARPDLKTPNLPRGPPRAAGRGQDRAKAPGARRARRVQGPRECVAPTLEFQKPAAERPFKNPVSAV